MLADLIFRAAQIINCEFQINSKFILVTIAYEISG